MVYNDLLGNKRLIERIRRQIAASAERSVSFHDFMQLCLYEPEHGYYTSRRQKIGKQGDFYTSDSLGGLLGGCLANCLANLAKKRGYLGSRPLLIEWGGGNGGLALQVLNGLSANEPELYDELRFISVEQSGYHQNLQKLLLAPHRAKVSFIEPRQWFASYGRELQEQPMIIFSNELLDAFPVYRVRRQRDQLYEIRVGWDDEERVFCEQLHSPVNTRLSEYMRDESIQLRERQTAELGLAGTDWLRQLMQRMSAGAVITIDYGDIADEVYAAHRMNGTFRCYYKHEMHDNPYIHIGEQDLTAHVNFSALIRAGEESGVRAWRLDTQKKFLVDNGILTLLSDVADRDPFHPAARRNRAVRQLLLSDGMSELFKVLVQII